MQSQRAPGYFWLGNTIFLASLVCFLALSVANISKSDHWDKIYAIAVGIYALQFPIYLTYIAFTYPYTCVFTEYTAGITYHANHTDLAATNSTAQVKWAVDATVKICIFGDVFGGWFCSNGGREFFSVLAHTIPICFMICTCYVKTFKADITLGRILADMVDITDFFLLLLEDDVILNYFGRDQCDGFLCNNGGGTGKYHMLWWVILFIFWESNAVNLWLLVSKIQTMKVAADGEESERKGSRHKLNKKVRLWLRVIGLDGAFLCIRLLCSGCYGVIASSLMLKIASLIIYDLHKAFTDRFQDYNILVDMSEVLDADDDESHDKV